jgi:hypothetical protein
MDSYNPAHSHKALSQIAEILALMEESNKNKSWIARMIKKEKVKAPIKLTMNSYQILSECPDDFIEKLLHSLKGQDIDDLADVSSLTKTYHWFFTDIVAASNPNLVTTEQVRKSIVLNELILRTETFKNHDPKGTVILPTGDGMAIGFDDSPEKPLRLSLELHRALNAYNKSKKGKEKVILRIGIDTGPVYTIKDLTGKDNVWGPGIIMTRRVMDLAGDGQIFASSRIADDIKNLSPEYKEILHPIGDYSIKHGGVLHLFNIYGDGFGNKQIQRKKKILKESVSDEDMMGINSFEFRNIEIILEILNTKTWMTHHTWKWDVFNISKEPRDQIFYYLDGDVARNFADMNVKVSDKDGVELDILGVSVNKPLHKEFDVKLKKSISPKRGIKGLKLEYDWEEPEHNFFYKLATDCKTFKYTLTALKGYDVKNRILRVDTELGQKWMAKPAPIMKIKDGKTIVTWDAKNLKAHQAFKFEW